MCGIVGSVDFRDGADTARIRQATALLKRRGPDDAGIWTEAGVGLGHRRLAIIDLSPAGHQPMVSSDGRFVIVLNGEIYNFQDLRAELDPGPGGWRSQSDTEVLLAAYAKWGRRCVEHFHGMFSFALWDRAERRLFAARDRMGVKPFYYHSGERRFFFASRPRAVLALAPWLSRTIDPQALRFYLEAGYVPAPWSIYTAVQKLPPAHWLQLDERGLKIERYWDFRAIAPEPAWEQRCEEDLVDELEELVTRSVRLRMVSDVPVGAFLSGGVDSSLVVALMRKFTARPVKSFTIGFDEPQYDESQHATKVAEALGTVHQSESMRVDDLLGLAPLFREEFDEPFFDSSAFPTLAVSRVARRAVTVSLSGDGGDELFGGYHYYGIVDAMEPYFQSPPSVRHVLAMAIRLFPHHRAKLLAAALREPTLVQAFAFSRSIAKDFGGVLSPEVSAQTTGLRELFMDASAAFPKALRGAERAMRLDALYTLPDDYLQKVDVASMAFSLESRDPLLDQDLVEWAMKLPLRLKLQGGLGKHLLRQVLRRHLPASLVDRPKQGFSVPIERWLRGPLRGWAEERLQDRGLFESLPLDQSKALSLLKLHLSGGRNVYPLLWAILVLLDFAADWITREPAPILAPQQVQRCES